MDRPRYETLDIVRIVAAAGVVLFHARLHLGLDFGPLDPVVASLDLGVLAFFSLSGFLVFLPFARGPVVTGEHMARRLLRIVPAYALAVAGTALLAGRLDPMLGGVTWTLVIEVAFYLALPVIVLAMVRIGGTDRRRQVAVLVAMAAVSLAARWLALGTDARSWEVTGRLAPLWLWAFLPGMLMAAAVTWWPQAAARLASWPVLALGLGMVAAALLMPTDTLGPQQLERMMVMAVGTALLIPGLLRLPTARWSRPVALSGRALSYPVYLWHTAAIAAVVALGLAGWVALGAAVVLTAAIAALSWRAVELPAIGLSAWLVARMRRRSVDDLHVPVLPDRGVARDEGAPADLRHAGVRVG